MTSHQGGACGSRAAPEVFPVYGRLVRCSVWILIALAAAATAHANGRPPQTNGVFVRPGDLQATYVRTTFGLLISHDDCTYRWVCEQNIGYGGQFDPKYAIATDGTIFATTYDGLRVSRDGGCTFTTATSDLPSNDPNRIADVWVDAIDIASDGAIWVATADSGHANDVFVSRDNGATFRPTGMQSPQIWWKSIRVAPTDPQKIYVTGYQVAGTMPDGGQMSPTAHLVRSTDGGVSWREAPLGGVSFGQQAVSYVMAVSPTEPDTIIYVSEYANPPMGDRIYRSTDGGQTLVEVLATTTRVRDVVFLDALTVVVAMGPADSAISKNAGQSFEPLGTWVDPQNNAPQLACLGKRGGELFGCGANWTPDFKALAKSGDGAHWNKVTRFVEIAGPIECPDGTPNKMLCDPIWFGPTGLQVQFGTTGPVCSAPILDQTPNPVSAPSGGCCEAGGTPASSGILGLMVFGVVRLRRRSRYSR